MSNHLLVIGGASADILHTTSATIHTSGGAGMYTAMAARRCGSPVSLFAPRPSPLPMALQPVSDCLDNWLGPTISPDDLAHFEITYLDGHTTYLVASVGAEANLHFDDLPDDLSRFGCIHIIPLGAPQRQLDFVQACRRRGAKRISVGNHFEPIRSSPEIVRQTIAESDICFMNEKESIELFGSLGEAKTQPGKLLFITLGAKGCVVIQGSHASRLETQPVDPLDPTGAGDSFCGAVLSGLMQGKHPLMAALSAMPLAAEMTRFYGPQALFFDDPAPAAPCDPRVKINSDQVEEIAHRIAITPEVLPFEFVGNEYPIVGHPLTLDFFFISTLQQFGFWTMRQGRYDQPLIAVINGSLQKGSMYLFHAYRRALEEQPEIFTPQRQACITESEMRTLLRADDGTCPMPALELHVQQARQYGMDMISLGLTPEAILQESLASEMPLETFVNQLDQIGGYKEDPLRKKTTLLALILNQRPEKFLVFGKNEAPAPVIDYHLMRSCLRTGLVEVTDRDLRERLTDRREILEADEWAVRWASYRTVEQVVRLSGKSMGAVDWFFFNARRRCPEMSDPVCAECPVDPACAHYKDLFQPVLRTVFY